MLLCCSLAVAGPIKIIPKPVKLDAKPGGFTLTGDTHILYSEDCHTEAAQLRHYLQPATGYSLDLKHGNQAQAGDILLRTNPGLSALGPEGYQLEVRQDRIQLCAPSKAGLFYGIQTLRQLFPARIYGNRAMDRTWRIPCASIQDRPCYAWRGMMLDVSRYFLPKAYVKRYMDLMAMHKLNVLQLHLVDDPGWRIQIDKYPKLTEVGAFRGEGAQRYGGYYSKDDIRELVSYAQELHIEIVPEIELPAHCQSALAAYPWLGCSEKKLPVPTKCYISPEILCAGKDSSYTFLKDVMSEVVELFPGRFIHIGGDEAKYTRWEACPHCKQKCKDEGLKSFFELQSHLTHYLEDFLMTKNRRLIGWDEILKGGLAPNATVMTWHRPETAVQAAKAGNNVVMALTGHAYFDTPESKLPGEPPAATWLPPISLRRAYEWEPAPEALNAEEKKFILGGHACVWTDRFMHNPILQDIPVLAENRSARYVDYLSLPRMAALAEVVWTPQGQRVWQDFTQRISVQYRRYSANGYHYRVPLPQVEKPVKRGQHFSVTMSTPVRGAEIRYTTDGSYPTVYSQRYTEPVSVNELKDLRAITVVAPRHHSLAFSFVKEKAKKPEK